MFGLGFSELILIFLIALIFIGPKKLPEIAKSLGKGIRDFQNAAKGFSDQLQDTNDKSNTESDEHPKVTDGPHNVEVIPPDEIAPKKEDEPS